MLSPHIARSREPPIVRAAAAPRAALARDPYPRDGSAPFCGRRGLREPRLRAGGERRCGRQACPGTADAGAKPAPATGDAGAKPAPATGDAGAKPSANGNADGGAEPATPSDADGGSRQPTSGTPGTQAAGPTINIPQSEAEKAEGRRSSASTSAATAASRRTTSSATCARSPGNLFKAENLASDVRELWDSGFFDDIEVDLTRDDRGVILRFLVRERPNIKAVEFEGNGEIENDKLQEAIEVKAEHDPQRPGHPPQRPEDPG